MAKWNKIQSKEAYLTMELDAHTECVDEDAD